MALAERDRELAAITRVLAGGGTLVIEGGAGIGKTALLDEASRRGRAVGWDVLRARGSELEAGFAFGIVRQLFERRLSDASEPERADVLAGPASLAGRLLLSETGEAAPVDSSFAILHGLYWLAVNLAARRPLLLVVDDVHFADGSSMRWLAHLGSRVEGLDLALVVAVRSSEPVSDGVAMTQLRADATVVRPGLLSAVSVGAIVRDALGALAGENVAATLATASGGNPFYLVELLRASHDEAVVSMTADELLLHGGECIGRHIRTRLRRLDPSAQTLARSLAVLGDGWPLRCGAKVARLSIRVAARAADDLVRFEVLATAERPVFLHPIIRDAIEATLRSHERSATHRRAARVLSDEGSPPGRVAAHLVRCPPSEDPWVVDRLRAAAREAMEAGAPGPAADLLRRALDEPPPAPVHVAVLRELARAELNAGQERVFDRLAEALARTEDRHVKSEIALEMAEANAALFRWAEAVDTIEAALATLGAADGALVERLEAAMVVAGLHDARRAGRVGAVLSRLGRDAGGAVGGAYAVATGMASVLEGRPADEAGNVLERALSDLGSPVEDWDTRAALLWALVTAERFDVVESALGSMRSEVERSGSARGLVAVFSTLGLLKLRLGALAEAETAGRIALRVLQEGDFEPGLAFGATVLADIAIEAGDLEEASRLLELPPSEPFTPGVGTVLIPAARGRLHLAQGRPREAFDAFQQCASMFASDVWGMDVRDAGYVHARSGAALAALRMGQRERAVSLADAELADVRVFGAPRALGVTLRAAGLAAGDGRGVELLVESVECLRRSPAVLERAKSLIDLGAALRRTGRRTEARELLAEGLDLAASRVARPLAARAREELAAAGARPRRDRRFGVEALTPSERRVAELAAVGNTNREIAQQLYVTLKTVEGHLAQAYTKLDVTGRGQLTRVLDIEKIQGGDPVADPIVADEG